MNNLSEDIKRRKKEHEERIAKIPVVEYDIMCDLGDGNDPQDELMALPIMPQIGHTIEVWVGPMGGVVSGGHSEWLAVKDVIVSAYAPDRIEVWVSTDGYSTEDILRIFKAIKNKEMP